MNARALPLSLVSLPFPFSLPLSFSARVSLVFCREHRVSFEFKKNVLRVSVFVFCLPRRRFENNDDADDEQKRKTNHLEDAMTRHQNQRGKKKEREMMMRAET